jgi:hypothetical protein
MTLLAGKALNAGGFTVDLRMRRFFFDRARTLNYIDQRKAKFLTKGGLYTRQAGRKLLGSPSKKSRPRPAGKPPRIHTTDERVTLRNILYHYDRHNDSVIVGPVGLNQVNTNTATLSSNTVPEIHEFGLEVLIREVSYNKGKTWWRRDLRTTRRPWYRYRDRRAKYPERKFMEPALKKTVQRVPELFGFDLGGDRLFGN